MSFVKHAKHAINEKLIRNGEVNVAIELLQKFFFARQRFLKPNSYAPEGSYSE
jgi:hypothetical protein